MSTIYLISCVVILTLFYYHYKSRRLHKKQINPEIQNQIITDTGKEINPEIATKNKWLHPTDEFGKMEKGVVYESKTYASEINENNDNITYTEIKLISNEMEKE